MEAIDEMHEKNYILKPVVSRVAVSPNEDNGGRRRD
jgi:hypothetical protein